MEMRNNRKKTERKEGNLASAADESILGQLQLWLAFTSVNTEWQLVPISWLIQNKALTHMVRSKAQPYAHHLPFHAQTDSCARANVHMSTSTRAWRHKCWWKDTLTCMDTHWLTYTCMKAHAQTHCFNRRQLVQCQVQQRSKLFVRQKINYRFITICLSLTFSLLHSSLSFAVSSSFQLRLIHYASNSLCGGTENRRAALLWTHVSPASCSSSPPPLLSFILFLHHLFPLFSSYSSFSPLSSLLLSIPCLLPPPPLHLFSFLPSPPSHRHSLFSIPLSFNLSLSSTHLWCSTGLLVLLYFHVLYPHLHLLIFHLFFYMIF